jgi:site-specific DNA-cytosine methylase
MYMLDLCAGLGGAHQAMKQRGWNVMTVDNNPAFNPDITADVTRWHYEGPRPDLLWASPPCTEFSRESQPWIRTGNPPDMAITLACIQLIDQIKPNFWVL